MRINVDSHFFGDKRVDRLATLCAENRLTTMGRLLQVWHYQNVQRTPIASAVVIDLHAEWTGPVYFGELMAQAYLARRLPEGTFEICGVRERIRYLQKASEHGKKSAQVRKEKYGTAQPREGLPKVPSRLNSGAPKVCEPLTLAPSPSLDQKEEKPSTSHPLLDLWNAGRGNLRACKEPSPERIRKAKELWKSKPEEHYWNAIIDRMRASPFLCGTNDRQWKAGVDFFLRQNTHIRVLEGEFDAGPSNGLRTMMVDL